MSRDSRHSSFGSEASQPSSSASVAEWLAWAERRIGHSQRRSPRLDAELLLAHALGTDRLGVLTRLREPLPLAAQIRFRDLVERRVSGEPVAYLRGRCAFWDFEIETGPAALVPRPETEILVELTLSLLPPAARQIADIGTGTGCILFALLRERPAVLGYATDLSEAALELARRNAGALALQDRIRFLHGDLVQPLLEQGLSAALDLIVSNPPYCDPAGYPRLEQAVRDHEPAAALLAPESGIGLHRRLLEEGGALLRPGGLLTSEIGFDQLERVRAIADSLPNWRWITVANDLQGHPRAVALQWQA
jgi:release factor glutamine methyltransferase